MNQLRNSSHKSNKSNPEISDGRHFSVLNDSIPIRATRVKVSEISMPNHHATYHLLEPKILGARMGTR